MDVISQLKGFEATSEFFIGVDSDGTAFDSMGIKHKMALIPAAIEIWNLKPVEKEYAEIAESINLYSDMRGINRFSGLLMAFELLAKRNNLKALGAILPDYFPLKQFVESGRPMSNSSLKEFSKDKSCAFLKELARWSDKGDELFARHVQGLRPFEYAAASLDTASRYADVAIISSAPMESLINDWREGGILQFVGCIAGQEAGNKVKQLEYAAGGKYGAEKVLLIGDAPGDMLAAKANGALFYPIEPGREIESWKRFKDEALSRFLRGSFSGEYENHLIEEFMKLLPPMGTAP